MQGALIIYCLVQLTGTEILNHSTLFLFTLTRPKSNTKLLQCQLQHDHHLLKEILQQKNKHFDLTFEESKIVW